MTEQYHPRTTIIGKRIFPMTSSAFPLFLLTLLWMPNFSVPWRVVPYKTLLMDELCHRNMGPTFNLTHLGKASSIILRTTNGHIGNGFNCTLKLVTREDRGLQYSISFLDIPFTCLSFLQVWGTNKNMSQKFCSNVNDPSGRQGGVLRSNVMHIQFYTSRHDWNFDRLGFEILITVYRRKNFKTCFREEFECNEERCIFADFACDHHNNCADMSDEQCGISGMLSLLICGTCVLLLVILIGCLISYIRKRRQLRPYDSSRATSLQSFESEASSYLRAPIRDPYYKPLYPIGQKKQKNALHPPFYLPERTAPVTKPPSKLAENGKLDRDTQDSKAKQLETTEGANTPVEKKVPLRRASTTGVSHVRQERPISFPPSTDKAAKRRASEGMMVKPTKREIQMLLEKLPEETRVD